MQLSAIGALAPVVLLCASFSGWSLLSFLFLLAFLVVQYKSQQGLYARPRPLLWMSVVLLATAVIVAEGITELAWAVFGDTLSFLDSPWLKIIGFSRLNPWESSSGVFLALLPQIAVAVTAAFALYHEQYLSHRSYDSRWDDNVLLFRTTLRNFVLPAILVLAGAVRPSWISLPYFIFSCVGLLHWSTTCSASGLAWGWMPLLYFTGMHIMLLYLHQVPLPLPDSIYDAEEYLGLFRIADMGWPEGFQVFSLLALYILLCVAVSDFQQPRQQSSASSLTDSLLPSHMPNIQGDPIPSRRWAVEQRRLAAFHHATINFFTYGFPICLVALIFWSFAYASLCAFGLLLYVGYIFYAFPSIHCLRRLNPVLLGFILCWTLCTFLFNAAFDIVPDVGTKIWSTVGLWHYAHAGLFVLAQFTLSVLIGTDIFVSNSILKNLNDAEIAQNDDPAALEEDRQDITVLILAVFAWCLHKSAHIISLVLLFVVGMKSGLLHAIYMIFFMIYLVSSSVVRKTRQQLIFLCEIHFATLYLLKLEWVYKAVESQEVYLKPILSQLGLWTEATVEDFGSIALLLIFTAVQNHGLRVLSSLSATVQQSPQSPLGLGILKYGNSGSFLLYVYATHNVGDLHQESNHVHWVTRQLAAIAETVRATYRSIGTYIVYATVLFVVYSVKPNYVALGYLCLLLFWIIGRQFRGRTDAALWLPMMLFAGGVFVLRYVLTAFPDLQKWLSQWVALLEGLGFDPNASLVEHLWDSLAILCVMQLYRYERIQEALHLEEQDGIGDYVNHAHGYVGFLKRLLILHSGKLLSIAVFYASITPVSATGFLYLIMLLITCNMSKSSRTPAQLFAIYTGLLIACEYLFQMWGSEFGMLPTQSHGKFAAWLGFQPYEKGFWGIEMGLRSKALVLVACIIQYCTLGWLNHLPDSLRVDEPYEEPCLLFLPYPRRGKIVTQASGVTEPLLRTLVDDNVRKSECRPEPATPEPLSLNVGRSHFVSVGTSEVSKKEARNDSAGTPDRYSVSSPWGSSRESRKWTKRAMLLLKQERYEAQWRTLKIYLKHAIEHFCQLYGLEFTMLVLLVASFAVLNVISLCYVLLLGLCIILKRQTLRAIWPFFVLLFACILITEYVVLGGAPPAWNIPPSLDDTKTCVNCWKTWLGLTVDDRQMLVAHFLVFIVSCFQLRANLSAGGLDMRSVQATVIPASDRLAWKEISYETTGQWTWLDHLRFFYYRHLLHVVLFLVFVTGTLQYDILHLGYLAFSLVFFRMRSTIMAERDRIFRFLRIYNFVLIVASLTYQAPCFPEIHEKCTMPTCLYYLVGFVKYDYGLKVTARSALVDITIFCLVGLQAHVFRSHEFEQVLRYLEAQQVDARAHAHEDKAAWKKEQLQRIRETEERNQRRRAQVDKIKTDMLHLQVRLDVLNSVGRFSDVSSPMIELADRKRHDPSYPSTSEPIKPDLNTPRGLERITERQSSTGQVYDRESPPYRSQGVEANEGDFPVIRKRRIARIREEESTGDLPSTAKMDRAKNAFTGTAFSTTSDHLSSSNSELDGTSRSPTVTRLSSPRRREESHQKQALLSGVQLIGDAVAQIPAYGSKGIANLVDYLNLETNDSDETSSSSTEDEGRSDKHDRQEIQAVSSFEEAKLSDGSAQGRNSTTPSTWHRLFVLWLYFWSQINSNTDVVCYFFFVLVYVWNFSLLTLVFPAALFLYALLANPGPSQYFWLAMLIYTELNILVQYFAQIYANHFDEQVMPLWVQKLGISPTRQNSFVVSVFPLFLVYLATLVQSSIKARDGEWMVVNENGAFSSGRRLHDPELELEYVERLSMWERLASCWTGVRESFFALGRGLLRYWLSLIHGSEAPPHFVQVSMNVKKWPEYGIQPERIESGFNRLLAALRKLGTDLSLEEVSSHKNCVSRVRVESIESKPDNPMTALAILEVIYAAPPKGSTAPAHYQSLTPAADVAFELQRAKDEGLEEETAFPHEILSVVAGGKREVDLYAYIFGTDLITFLYVALLYQSAVKNNPEFFNVYQSVDQFPKEFVFVLMTLFFMIVVDRVVYLWSFALGKVLFYLFSLGLYTIYVTDFVWGIDPSGNDDWFMPLLPLRGFYLMKALSLSFQALQIKYGLPQKSALYGQFFTRSINQLSWFGFRVYRAVPFLFELRCVLDWSCTTTALTMYDWLKLEDIYASLFLVQCDIKIVRQPHCLGQRQGMRIKFLSGVLVFSFLICVIWAPMLIYSSGNPTNGVNAIYDTRIHLEVRTTGGRFTLYETGLCQIPFMEDVLQKGWQPFSSDALVGYEMQDVQLLCCGADSDFLWAVPAPSLSNMMESIDDEFELIAWWEFTRNRPKSKEIAVYSSLLSDPLIFSDEETVTGLKETLKGNRNSLYINATFPKYLRIPASGEVHDLLDGVVISETISGNLSLVRSDGYSWWSFIRSNVSQEDGCGNIRGPLAIAVSEEVPTGIFGDTLSRFSIWSLYITFVLAVGRFIRLQCADIRMRIPYENFPACDRLVAICEDIYAARAQGELALEEGLFWTLINIYRSPHVLMEYTKAD